MDHLSRHEGMVLVGGIAGDVDIDAHCVCIEALRLYCRWVEVRRNKART